MSQFQKALVHFGMTIIHPAGQVDHTINIQILGLKCSLQIHF